jgi:hypothetical protein
MKDQPESVLGGPLLHRHAVDESVDGTIGAAEGQQSSYGHDPDGVFTRREHSITDYECKGCSEI